MLFTKVLISDAIKNTGLSEEMIISIFKNTGRNGFGDAINVADAAKKAGVPESYLASAADRLSPEGFSKYCKAMEEAYGDSSLKGKITSPVNDRALSEAMNYSSTAQSIYDIIKETDEDVAKIYNNFTVEEISNLKSMVIKEGQALKDMGLTNKQLGPAIAGVYNKSTGKFYTAINDVEGKIPSELSPIIADRINNMPQEVLDSYTYTYGAGSHAEVYAVNKALLDNPNVNIDDLLVYINKTLGTSRPVRELPFHTCPHCKYILHGFNILSDLQ